MGSAKLYLDALPAEYELLAGTHAMQPNLAIGKVLTEKALDLAMAKIERCQKMSDSLKADMKTCLLRRARNTCKAVAQGLARRPQPTRVAASPWMLGAPAKPKEEILAEPPRAAEALIYGWNQELQLAWRSRKPAGRASPSATPPHRSSGR